MLVISHLTDIQLTKAAFPALQAFLFSAIPLAFMPIIHSQAVSVFSDFDTFG